MTVGLAIDQITVFDANGISVFSKNFNEAPIDHSLLAAFFSAIRQFASHMIHGEIQGIKIGSVMLNFKILPREQEGDNMIFMMLSTGFSESSSSEIAEGLSEEFAIKFEEFLQDHGITLHEFQNKIHKWLDEFSEFFMPVCENLVEDVMKFESISLDLPIKVPTGVLKALYDILSEKPLLNELYEHGPLDMIIEMLQNYIYSSKFKEDLEDKYNGS